MVYETNSERVWAGGGKEEKKGENKEEENKLSPREMLEGAKAELGCLQRKDR